MEPLNTSSVAIDGRVVRKIREEKRLTQFYVSKVVGVTIDTVSRWENNRYPTIMRDNALKLAEALEVELDEILQHEDDTVPDGKTTAAVAKKRTFFGPLLMGAVVLVALAGYFTLRPTPVPPVTLQAERILPPYAAPGSTVLIRVEISSDKQLKGMILKEIFPPGWTLVKAQPVVSHLDTAIGKARWIFRKPPLKNHLFYLLKVPDTIDDGANITFHGDLIANPDGQRTAISVESVGKMKIAPYHWADTNGDGVIDDLEILELSDLTEEADSLPLDWDLIELIWETGGYRWSPEKKSFIPVEPPAEP